MDSSGEMGMLDPNAPLLAYSPPLSPPPGVPHALSPNFCSFVKIHGESLGLGALSLRLPAGLVSIYAQPL